MQWQEIRKHHPQQWLLVEAIKAHSEVNKRIVPRKRHESTQLNEGDKVELVTLVGGG